MCLMMKMISLSFDYLNPTEETKLNRSSTHLEFLSYVLSVQNTIFGPWMSFKNYIHYFDVENSMEKLDFFQFVKWVFSFIRVAFCLIVSTCLTDSIVRSDFFSDDDQQFSSLNWRTAYFQALSYRFSHYCVCFIGQLTGQISGLKFDACFYQQETFSDRQKPKTKFSNRSKPTIEKKANSSIVEMFEIEFPRSLVNVVIFWNIPMHYWLKIYVFRPVKTNFGHLTSIIATYFASALLHGFNFQLSIVLFSIGLFAYVEFGFRRKLSRILDCCVGARRCRSDCSCDEHRFGSKHPLTIVINLILSILSLCHLTYLGLLFDGSAQQTIGYSFQHVLDKWANFHFSSHLFVIGTYVLFRSL